MSENLAIAIPDSTNNPVDLSQLLQTAQLTAMSVNGMSQQMGLVNAKLNNHDAKFSEVDERLNAFDSRMTTHERTVTLTNYQAKLLYNAVASRVAELLKGDADKISERDMALYYGKFRRKLWGDAKKHSKVAQNYQFSLQCDYDEIMSYIGSWYPEGYSGVDGYKEHLDKVRSIAEE